MSGIPTVKFDTSRVTETVKAELRKNVLFLEGIDRNHFEQIYSAALHSILAGRDLGLLCNVLMRMNIDGMTKQRAGEIARILNNQATALMDKEHSLSLGIKQAHWRYSGAPCEVNPTKPTGQDAAHKAANGRLFEVSMGMFVNGKWTWPSVEPGCRCISTPVIPGFS